MDKTPEWHAARALKVTGSRLPRILGLSPYGNAKSVMREWVREHFGDPPEFEDTPATRWGTDHEDEAITQYMIDHGVMVHSRHGFFPHPKYEWLQIEPDGIAGHTGTTAGDVLVEAKCPWRSRWVHVSQRPDYEVQMRLGMECTGLQLADLAVWYPDPPLWVSRIEHDPTWLTEGVVLAGGAFLPPVMPVLDAFRAEFEKIIASEKLSAPFREPLRNVRLDDEFAAAEIEYAEALAVRDAADAQVAEAKKRLEELSAGRTTRGRYWQVIHSDQSGQIPYAKLLAEHAPDVDVEKYRGEKSHRVTIRAVGKAK